MTPEERELLNRVAKMTEENNDMLHAIRRSMRWGTIMRTVYWVLIIGSAVGAFWIIQPYLDALGSGGSDKGSLIQQVLNAYN